MVNNPPAPFTNAAAAIAGGPATAGASAKVLAVALLDDDGEATSMVPSLVSVEPAPSTMSAAGCPAMPTSMVPSLTSPPPLKVWVCGKIDVPGSPDTSIVPVLVSTSPLGMLNDSVASETSGLATLDRVIVPPLVKLAAALTVALTPAPEVASPTSTSRLCPDTRLPDSATTGTESELSNTSKAPAPDPVNAKDDPFSRSTGLSPVPDATTPAS